MIFIENKKSWKSYVKTLDQDDHAPAPKEYPCYADSRPANSFDPYIYTKYYYLKDFLIMVATIEKGKEF